MSPSSVAGPSYATESMTLPSEQDRRMPFILANYKAADGQLLSTSDQTNTLACISPRLLSRAIVSPICDFPSDSTKVEKTAFQLASLDTSAGLRHPQVELCSPSLPARFTGSNHQNHSAYESAIADYLDQEDGYLHFSADPRQSTASSPENKAAESLASSRTSFL